MKASQAEQHLRNSLDECDTLRFLVAKQNEKIENLTRCNNQQAEKIEKLLIEKQTLSQQIDLIKSRVENLFV